jgi:hypothetical protein
LSYASKDRRYKQAMGFLGGYLHRVHRHNKEVKEYEDFLEEVSQRNARAIMPQLFIKKDDK